MSIDLRRSTELMLKSRDPKAYARFITGLSNRLRRLVLDHHGLFEKFTGDGILAFFPDFYTGLEDAGYYVIAVAEACHAAFEDHYRRHRTSFTSILSSKSVGLGIGVDYGTIHLVSDGEDLAIVGSPVVYACRMAATRAGNTLLNQAAYELIANRFSKHSTIVEEELDVKHEGPHVAYSVRLNGQQQYVPMEPAWRKFATSVDAAPAQGSAVAINDDRAPCAEDGAEHGAPTDG